MERRIGFAVLLLMSGNALAGEVVYECGSRTTAAFNGWRVDPYAAFSAIEFKEETVAFHVANGGEYTLRLTRQIEAMKAFSTLQFDIRFGEISNCILNFVDVLVSKDGRIWKAVDVDQSDLTGFIHDAADYSFFQIAANVSFFKDGFIECSYFKLEGEDPVELVSEPAPVIEEVPEAFFVFCFNKSINVETKNELPYEVIFTNLAGQVVYRESAVGSTRVESGLPEGVYLISILQQGAVMQKKKVVF